MRLIRVFPRRTKATPTDELAFIGEPPLPAFLPEADEVHVSVTFTGDKPEADRLARSWERVHPHIRIGGPAHDDPGGPFVPGMYLREGYVVTSRGCPNSCGFCFVPRREGGIRELPVTEGWDVIDNNLLACSDRHLEDVFAMLLTQKQRARFTGGLDARILKERPQIIDRLCSVRLEILFLAYDYPGTWRTVEWAIHALRRAGLSRDQVHCYVLAGYVENDTPQRAAARAEQVLEAGGIPFMMLFQPADGECNYGPEWKAARYKYVREPAMMPAGRRKELAARLAREAR